MEIKFIKDTFGVSTARIDDLEIQLSYDKNYSNYVAEISIYERIIELSCDYGECPKKVKCEDCSYCTEDVELCPYGKSEDQATGINCFSCDTFNELKTKIIKIIECNYDGIAHRKVWPKNAATKFINRHWIVDIG